MLTIYIYIYLFLARDPFEFALSGFVTRWNGRACPPAWNGPWLPMGTLGLPNWVLSWTQFFVGCLPLP